MKKNLLIGLALSVVFCYLAFRGINLDDLSAAFRSARYGYLLPTLLLVLISHYLRCFRWGVILASIIRYPQKRLFAIGSIGFMGVNLLPARLGEFVRPYLVKQHDQIRMSTTMATVVVERLFDLLALLLLMFVVLLNVPLPPMIFTTGMTTLVVTFCLLLGLIVLAFQRELSLRIIDWVFGWLPERLAHTGKRLARSFIDGLQVLPDIRRLLYVAGLSLLIWATISMTWYCLFFAFDLPLGLSNAFALAVIVALGVMLPAAPGFVGTYHYACVLGLTFFGIDKAPALSYSIAAHFLQLIPVVALGLAFLPFEHISLPGMLRREAASLHDEGLD